MIKIFVYEDTDVTRHINIAMKAYHNVMREFGAHLRSPYPIMAPGSFYSYCSLVSSDGKKRRLV